MYWQYKFLHLLNFFDESVTEIVSFYFADLWFPLLRVPIRSAGLDFSPISSIRHWEAFFIINFRSFHLWWCLNNFSRIFTSLNLEPYVVTLVSPLVFRILLKLNFACLDRSKLWTASPLDTSNQTFGLDIGDENANNYFTAFTIMYCSISIYEIEQYIIVKAVK